MLDLLLSLLLALLSALSPAPETERPAFETRPPITIPAPVPPCNTDAECYAQHPDTPEPGHDETEEVISPAPFVPEPEGEGEGEAWSVTDAMTELGHQPCEHEDGHNFPCYWDAANRGDGTGTSFLLLSEEDVIYFN